MAGGQGLTDDPYRVLQVHTEACREVIDAAFSVLREKLMRDDPPDAPSRLARLNAAHRVLTDPGLRDAHDSLRADFRHAAPLDSP
jgi:curved DNA-binding protein CbpA